MSDDPGNPDLRRRPGGQVAADLRRHIVSAVEAGHKERYKRPGGVEGLRNITGADLRSLWDDKGPGGRDAETDPARARRSGAADRARSDAGGRGRAAECGMADRAMNADVPDEPLVQRALADSPKERFCLRCATAFPSEGFGERICKRCKGSHSWKNPANLHHATPRKT